MKKQNSCYKKIEYIRINFNEKNTVTFYRNAINNKETKSTISATFTGRSFKEKYPDITFKARTSKYTLTFPPMPLESKKDKFFEFIGLKNNIATRKLIEAHTTAYQKTCDKLGTQIILDKINPAKQSIILHLNKYVDFTPENMIICYSSKPECTAAILRKKTKMQTISICNDGDRVVLKFIYPTDIENKKEIFFKLIEATDAIKAQILNFEKEFNDCLNESLSQQQTISNNNFTDKQEANNLDNSTLPSSDISSSSHILAVLNTDDVLVDDFMDPSLKDTATITTAVTNTNAASPTITNNNILDTFTSVEDGDTEISSLLSLEDLDEIQAQIDIAENQAAGLKRKFEEDAIDNSSSDEESSQRKFMR